MVDVPTARYHGVCPSCEGYGGRTVDGYGFDCPNELCIGSCPSCWCLGCQDGRVDLPEPEHGEGLMGSWEAFAFLHPEEAAKPPFLTGPLQP